LMRTVWPGTFVEEGNLTFNISTLRRALGQFECIETVPRRGYRFTAQVHEVATDPGSTTDAPVRRKIPAGKLAIALGALVLAGAILIISRIGRIPGNPRPSPFSRSSRSTPPMPTPFCNSAWRTR
jgi:hypothetical protein